MNHAGGGIQNKHPLNLQSSQIQQDPSRGKPLNPLTNRNYAMPRNGAPPQVNGNKRHHQKMAANGSVLVRITIVTAFLTIATFVDFYLIDFLTIK